MMHTHICGGTGRGVRSRSLTTLKSRCPLLMHLGCLAADDMVKPLAILGKPPAKGPSLMPPLASYERGDFVYQMYSRTVKVNRRSG